MEPMESLQVLNLAVKTLSEIETLLIDDDVREKLTDKVLEVVGIEKSKRKKSVMGSQEKILESLQRLGGSAVRSAITSDSRLDPNAVSSLLTKRHSCRGNGARGNKFFGTSLAPAG